MLRSLTLKNLAIIDNIQIDFDNGMTVLTGETGAGKSLIIDAIGLLFGDRASSDLVRTGENKTVIEGVFTDYSNKVKEILSDLEIDDEDVLIIKREIYSNGKSVGKINGNTVLLSSLSLIGIELGNIHSQYDTQKLINPNNYYSYLDDDNSNEIIKEYQYSLKEYRKFDKEYKELLKSANENIQKLDYLKYQINELSKAKLDINEEEGLQKEFKILSSYEKIKNHYINFIDCYENNNVLDNIYNSLNSLQKLSDIDEELLDKYNKLNDLYENLNDLIYEITNDFNKRDFDEGNIDIINERLSIYSDLKRKYKMNTEQLIEYYNDIKNEIDKLENHDFYLEEALKNKNKVFNKCLDLANNITEIRKKNAVILKEEIINNLKDLQLMNVEIEIVISQEKCDKASSNYFKNNGQDLIDFLVSFNKGESIKSLSKTLSGGELSRFMLALKQITSSKTKNQTLIFDEIDTGVSGEVAYAIAKKIKEISKYSQVLCITHLPQVASISDNHYNITKKVIEGNKTITEINYLEKDERVHKIAGMISKDNITNASISLAKELLGYES